jgi:hypothetical protein
VTRGHYLVDESDLDLDGGTRVYSYASTEKLLGILETEQLWLSPYSTMNDPREAKAWFPDMTSVQSDPSSPDDIVRRIGDGLSVDWLLRRGACLACFTVDRDRLTPNTSWFHRGWARARMWDQYAEHHQGAVLVFDTGTLLEVVENTRVDADVIRRSWGLVDYVDEQMTLTIDLADLRVRGVASIVENLIDRQHGFSQLYFRKNTDWESEREYRIVVARWNTAPGQSEAPIKVAFGSALRAVIFGEDSSYETRRRARDLLADYPSVELFRAVWLRGAPYLDLLGTND